MFNFYKKRNIKIVAWLLVIFFICGGLIYFSLNFWSFFQVFSKDVVAFKIYDVELRKSKFDPIIARSSRLPIFLNPINNFKELVKQYVINQECQKLNIVVSDQEVYDFILYNYGFDEQSLKKYPQYEEIMFNFKNSLLLDRLQQHIIPLYVPTDLEKQFMEIIKNEKFFQVYFFMQWLINKINESSFYLHKEYYYLLPQPALKYKNLYLNTHQLVESLDRQKKIFNIDSQSALLVSAANGYDVLLIKNIADGYDQYLSLFLLSNMFMQYFKATLEISDNDMQKVYKETPVYEDPNIVVSYVEIKLSISNIDILKSQEEAVEYIDKINNNEHLFEIDGELSRDMFRSMFGVEELKNQYEYFKYDNYYYVVKKNDEKYQYKLFPIEINVENKEKINRYASDIFSLLNNKDHDLDNLLREYCQDNEDLEEQIFEKKFFSNTPFFDQIKNEKKVFKVQIGDSIFVGWKISELKEKRLLSFEERKEKIYNDIVMNRFNEEWLKMSKNSEIEIVFDKLKQYLN